MSPTPVNAEAGPCDVVLVSPPWRPPGEPCLALATLAPLVRAAGYRTATIHATFDYPDTSVDELFMASYGAHLFGASLVPADERAPLVDPLVARFTDDLNLHGLIIPGATLADLERDEAAMRAWVARAFVDAERCLERAAARIAAAIPRAILMSATFEGQVVAGLALVRKLRQLGVTAPVALGGAACFEEAARALMTHYGELEAVCVGEGERVVVPLVEALLGERPLAGVPGITWREGPGAVRVNPCPPAAALDDSPPPDYDGYETEWRASAWQGLEPRLFLELSRGCWWGQKHLCTFCGLNADYLDFRAKSPARATHEIRHLHERYRWATRLAATDNILAMRYVDTVLPELAPLAEAPRPLRLFFEVKSNLRKDQLAQLHRAGIRHVQPGIESFDDEILTLMKKGNTALGQVQFIKWCAELGVRLSYNIIVMNPGEPTAAYERMLPLIDAIDHLPSPDHVTPMWLERFSPYQQAPERWGIRAVRPRAHYAAIYPDLGTRAPEALDDLSYVFDFACDALESREHHEAVRTFALRVGRWQWDWEELTAWHEDDGLVTLVDTRPGREHREVLDELASSLYRWLDEVRPHKSLVERFGARVDTLLERWRERGHVIADARERWLATLPRRATELLAPDSPRGP